MSPSPLYCDNSTLLNKRKRTSATVVVCASVSVAVRVCAVSVLVCVCASVCVCACVSVPVSVAVCVCVCVESVLVLGFGVILIVIDGICMCFGFAAMCSVPLTVLPPNEIAGEGAGADEAALELFVSDCDCACCALVDNKGDEETPTETGGPRAADAVICSEAVVVLAIFSESRTQQFL